ncbi:Nitrogen network kinase 1 [Candida viswanathii]|uniref:Nitrogen network kinase 1 n=1 Tax=Candida viswanathii TaxID=5486 RepID=A0A367YPU0_9ASCO|nr:Nitrogen network kinase 1 [Candida viswanathii]
MDIPLKSQPKVSTVNLLDESKFRIGASNNTSSASLATETEADNEPPSTQLNPNLLKVRHSSKQQTVPHQQHGFPPNYSFSRRYSETEKNNFDPDTGHRIFEDGKIRPHQAIKYEQQDEYSNQLDQQPHNNYGTYINDYKSSNQLHSRSHDSINSGYKDETGYEEFIPGLDFSTLVMKWNNNSNSNLDLTRSNTSDYTTQSNTPRSREASYLDLNQLHSKVAPQPIKSSNNQQPKFSYSRLHEVMKTKQQAHLQLQQRKNIYDINEDNNDIIPLTKDNFKSGSPSSGKRETSGTLDSAMLRKKQKSAIDPVTGDINYELIINSLPQNFNDLPYSQRKKLVKSFSESIDYSQFSLFAKNYLGSSIGSSSKTPRGSSSVGIAGSGGGVGGNGSGSTSSSFSRRHRTGSVNTIAGRLLARTSTTDFKKLQEANRQKHNVDEKNAIVLNHRLGGIIGYGAWGTIRDCTDLSDGTLRAIKIVKSNVESNQNPKVLQLFKKEISIWSVLKHPNILGLIDYIETDGTIFCLMDRINGGSLFDTVDSWSLFNAGLNSTSGPVEFLFQQQRERLVKCIDYSKQIVNALLYMHEEQGIVHGDLKLENVLISRELNDSTKIVLCDFGMSRIFSTRISRKSSKRQIHNGSNHNSNNNSDNRLSLIIDTETEMARSKSSNVELRKPLISEDSPNTRKLFHDDSRVGLDHLFRIHGPSMQSVQLTPVTSHQQEPQQQPQPMRFNFSKYQQSHQCDEPVDSNLPHSHIGSLPYASPEILQPSPPPLGPSADVWALGVLIYAMIVGRLPFQHHYEPRLRAMIASGKFNTCDLAKACLLEWLFDEENSKKENKDGDSLPSALLQSSSLVDMQRVEQLSQLKKDWEMMSNHEEFSFLYDIVIGCLQVDITKRIELSQVYNLLCSYNN